MNIINKRYAKLTLWILVLIVVSSLIGSFTKNDIDTWYQTLNHAKLTPPNYLFGVVWSVLYVMIATSGWMIWEAEFLPNLKLIKKLYLSQLILNWSWSPLFFHYHLIGVSLLCLVAIIILVTTLVIKTYNKLKIISLFLTPYLLWLSFASYLNFFIWMYN